jgi:2,3-bisphosphoglycerate-independent phosphoglycerate mutase
MADLPINNKTPLSEARKPNMDYMARNGMLGEIITVEKKLWSDMSNASVSHVANLSLLGYDPKRYNLQRGPLEAVGADQPFENGDLAVRCNFATVDKDLVVLERRAGRNSFGLDELARYVNEHVNIGVPFILRNTFEHRGVIIIKKKLSDKISNTDPLKVGECVKPVEALAPEAEESAKLLQEFLERARGIIEFHPINQERIKRGIPPANCILTREAGNQLPVLGNFLKLHHLQKAVCIAENGVMKATCMLAGFNAITVPEMKLEPTLDFIFDSIENALGEYDLVYAHIKGPDEPAHDGNFHSKRAMIERIDRELEKFKNFNGIFVVATDHITSCKTRQHEYGAVPILIYGKGRESVGSFDEFTAKKGKLGLLTGKKLWKFLLKK